MCAHSIGSNCRLCLLRLSDLKIDLISETNSLLLYVVRKIFICFQIYIYLYKSAHSCRRPILHHKSSSYIPYVFICHECSKLVHDDKNSMASYLNVAVQ